MWSGRFEGGLDKQFEEWQRSFPFDQQLLPQEAAASSAYARALRKAGALSQAELQQVLAGLQQIVKDAAEEPAILRESSAEDVHHFVEMELVKRIGEVGYKLHSGRSRNEQIATDLRLFVRDSGQAVASALAELCGAMLERAEKHAGDVMPAYTHLQRAEPVLVSHWLLAYFEMFLRDIGRVEDCLRRSNECPLGSGAIAGSTLPVDRRQMAEELGFTRPTANSMDATSDRDFALEYVNALTMMAMHLSRWAEEMILFSTQEYGFVRLPEAYATGSSAMPQKQNPDLLELVRGKAARMLGASVSLAANLKALPLAYNKDLQETQQPLFESAHAALSMLQHVAGFMRAVQFDKERMQAAATGSFMNAFAAATYLAKQGVPFRTAHEQVGRLVKKCVERHCQLQELPPEELQAIAPQAGKDFPAAVGLKEVLAMHDVAGGTAPAQVEAAIEGAQARLRMAKGEAHAGSEG